MTTYVRDNDGKFIPASQRPDGTWRKARRVKDGYVPQEEVPLYESKGKQFAKKPDDLPVGLCPLIAKASREKREKQLKQQHKVPGLIPLPSNQPYNNHQPQQHQSQTNNKSKSKQGQQASTTGASKKVTIKFPTVESSNTLRRLSDAMTNVHLTSDEDILKQLKKLRKKIREIEAIEDKLKTGELKCPEQDQLDKVARKQEIQKQIKEWETREIQLTA